MTADLLLACLLSAVLIWAGALNVLGPAFIREEFEAWGYPNWFRIAVGLTEWVAAVCLVIPALRMTGCVLATAVLVGVVGTFWRDRQKMRMEYPLVLLALTLIVAARSSGVI